MNRPIPSGTRDVLPDEMRELRAITGQLRDVFENSGYGEVYTPAIEYESVIGGHTSAGVGGAYHLFDEHGDVLALRTDMTVPIARITGTRYATAELPLRFCYAAHVYRVVRAQRGQPREFLQAGIELIGAPAPHGTAEALTVLCAALDATGLKEYRVGLGDAALMPALLGSLGVEPEGAQRILAELVARNFVGLEHEARQLGVAEAVLAAATTRGGAEVLEVAPGPLGDALSGLRGIVELLEPAVAQRVIFDFGLVRDLDYYTGAVFEVYDPALGTRLGGGGRYDDLLGQFGRSLPAVGFAINVDRLHHALAGEERGVR
jgi:ATP phosphoribosyltransferase regulatory subunit